jgi:hypothetical protein
VGRTRPDRLGGDPVVRAFRRRPLAGSTLAGSTLAAVLAVVEVLVP